MSSSTKNDTSRGELLAQEYLQLQRTVEEFDSKALTIKAWSVTISAAGIVTAYVEGNSAILLVASISALAFWLAEALWKTSQQAYYPRIWEIEVSFKDSTSKIEPFQIATSWSKTWRKNGRGWHAFRIALWGHIFMPNLIVALVGLALFLLWPPDASGPLWV